MRQKSGIHKATSKRVVKDIRRAPALKELLDKLEETSGTDASFALAWGEYTRTDDQGAREAALDRALQDYLSRTDRASEPHHFLSDLANYYQPKGGWFAIPALR